MADNISVANDSTNVVAELAADDIGGVKYSRSKITLGADGDNDGDVSATNPMPVIGDVTVSGVATAANQAAEIVSLTSIDGKTPALGQALSAASVPVVLPATQITTLTPPEAITGFALEAGHLATIDTSTAKIPSQGQALAAASMPVVLPATQITSLTAPVLAAGSAIVGKVGIDQTTPGTTNLVALAANQSVNVAQVNGVATTMGNGVSGTGVQRVTIASDSTGQVTLAAGTNLVGKVNTQATTSGGYSASRFISAGSVIAANIKNSAGQVYKVNITNINATPVYVRLYDQTASPATTDTPVWAFTVPGNTAGAGAIETFPDGLVFATGIGWRVTASIADNDNTVLASNTVLGNIAYK